MFDETLIDEGIDFLSLVQGMQGWFAIGGVFHSGRKLLRKFREKAFLDTCFQEKQN